MGKIIKIDNPESLVVTQPDHEFHGAIKLDQLRKKIEKSQKDPIIPLKESNKNLLIIDGHNTSVIIDYLNSIGKKERDLGVYS
ncbi:MAG: hypothetical protein KC516_04590 [Nanoarchaeota archaeon]|nr:hypothetical protein [Nanoarchaeota archaeon]